jgi:hypothetical protein
LLIVCGMSSTESDERYEVVVKHDMKGVLHMGSFKTLSQARAFLFDHWKKLPGERAMKDIEYGGAIYDKHDGRRRVLVFTAILGHPDGFRQVGDVSYYQYSNRLASGWGWDKGDYEVAFRNGRVVSYGATGIRPNPVQRHTVTVTRF